MRAAGERNEKAEGGRLKAEGLKAEGLMTEVEGRESRVERPEAIAVGREMKIGRELLAAAFVEWRRRYSESPHQFLIETKALQEDPQRYGEEMADFFLGLMGSARRDDNVYMTLHDHFIQTGVLRKRIAELMNASK